jgi:hypothetical protein
LEEVAEEVLEAEALVVVHQEVLAVALAAADFLVVVLAEAGSFYSIKTRVLSIKTKVLSITLILAFITKKLVSNFTNEFFV